MITAANIRELLATPPRNIDDFVPHLNKYMEMYDINTPLRVAHFISQIGHESGSFRWVREIWGPTAAQQRYERDFTQPWPERRPGQRNSVASNLGNTNTGDGKFFMGRGLLQVTGRWNYGVVSRHIFGDSRLHRSPQLLEQPEYAVWSACYLWDNKGLNEISDRGTTNEVVKAVTRRVNGGHNGLPDRISRFKRAIRILNVK